jgi:uncharacterized membrane protein YdjX (TVP38/TMEM64 family)
MTSPAHPSEEHSLPVVTVRPQSRLKRWLPWLLGLLFLAMLGLLWPPLAQLSSDRTAIRGWIETMGPLAPALFFVMNVAQIVVAPIPGYPVQVLGGILFGPLAGSIYTVGGMTAGGTLAAWLGRRLGRPWLEKQLGQAELARWRDTMHIDSFWLWWIVLLIPLGDIPYFLAGLSKIRLLTFALAIFTSRGPFTVLIVVLGDQVLDLPLTWIALLVALFGLAIIFGFSQSERLARWGQAYVTFISRAGQGNSKNP